MSEVRMMKKRMNVIVILTAIILSFGLRNHFSSERNDEFKRFFSEEIESLHMDSRLLGQVVLVLDHEIYSITDRIIEFTIYNQSEIDLIEGFNHSIDYFNGNFWEELERTTMIGDIGRGLPANTSSRHQVLLGHFASLPEGLLRIRTSVGTSWDDDLPISHHLVAEFYFE